ncbi:winged helix-turn-helix domain-containing protein [Alkalinema sp. FACHB-956]|uniref:winged helix-turn-helix domain-containing protein n=1 Tax=Alkalinema sp. FACHB-956 TaxID=2692768 RepID=UPI001689F94C|nr:response regulator transcription factor [Alkalinema sp. FACHB-956]
MNILFIEDEARIADFVQAGLKEQGFVVDYCDNGDDGNFRALENEYDVILLDIMVPGKDGLAVLKTLRRAGRNVPVILLTARNELDDRLEGLNLGADDYLAKPFFVEELVARIHAVVRRSHGDRQNLLSVGPLKLDRITREVTCNQHMVELTSREFNLLEYLMRSPGRVLTRTQILEHVWGYDFNPNTNVVDVCIQRIRKKLDPIGGTGWLESVRGVGYRFRQPDGLSSGQSSGQSHGSL